MDDGTEVYRTSRSLGRGQLGKGIVLVGLVDII